jgi:hypothetical protein
MTRTRVRLQILVALVFVMASSARAGGTDASSSEIPLGDIPHFSDEASARAGCGADPVVWADRRSGFFYPKFHPDFGKTANGVYTCYSKAKKADYWSLTPEGDGGRERREFPKFFCTQCS